MGITDAEFKIMQEKKEAEAAKVTETVVTETKTTETVVEKTETEDDSVAE